VTASSGGPDARLSRAPDARLGQSEASAPAGVRVVLDVRPLQAPDRAPLAAAYLDGLLTAFDAAPLGGESFAFLLGSDLDDPTERYRRLDVVGRRQLPPTRLLRSGAMTVDPFVLRGAAVGSAWRAERGGAAGAVYHAVGGGPLPIASGLPVVVTLLDLAPWELPDRYQRTVASRFGQRLRAQILRDAAAVVVGSRSTARDARRLLRIHRDRLHVVALAPRPAFRRAPVRSADEAEAAAATDAAVSEVRDRLGLPARYLAMSGRFDARLDLATLLAALESMAAAGRPAGLGEEIPWPPRVVLLGASPDDRAAIARAAARRRLGEQFAYAPGLSLDEVAGIVRGARAIVQPVVSEATGLPAIEAIAAGTPVVASAVGPLPELIGGAGLLVEPRDAARLAVALTAIWVDDRVHEGIAAIARERAASEQRTWADVAAETRSIYAGVGVRRDRT
jgi:glycosyltransferase involved in cell wall biosynthesis